MRELSIAIVLFAGAAFAQPPTPGYPERVLQWTVKNGETCDEIAEALYGSATEHAMLERYNAIRCVAGQALPDGMTLVVPEKPTTLPTARLQSLKPDVRARAAGSGWSTAEPGMALYERSSVNTLEKARADILFADRTRVVLGEHTLVVIYDTAKHTDVARTPPSVELETGEVQAGLAALRGKPIAVGTEGGLVSGSSRETVVRAGAKRATVSVFDGGVKVSSAGQSVDVPKHHGTSFSRGGAPSAPRPLPPAPHWTDAFGKSVITAGWDAVPNSASYRIEVARDVEFRELVLREEVPARVRAFRAEKLPPGAYFMRVRAIDRDDFMGIASTPRAVVLSEAREHGQEQSRRSELSRNDGALGLDGASVAFAGVSVPIVSPSPFEDVEWWAPTRANAVALEATGYLRAGRFGLNGAARASGSLGAFGLDARVATSEVTGPTADGSAWFRLRWRSFRSESSGLELGPALELGIPLTRESAPTRAGLGAGIGGSAGNFSWLADAGGRIRLFDDAERHEAPAVQGYALVGGSYDPLEWWRIYTLLDAHILDRDTLAGRGGLALGTELGGRVFVGGALRLSPWDDAGGTLIGQLSVGIRDRR